MNSSLRLQQEIRHFITDTGAMASARTMQPSKASGGWPGNPETIREWKVCPKGQAIYHHASAEEILALEAQLNPWAKPELATHSTLGKPGVNLVVVLNERKNLQEDLKMAISYTGNSSDEQLVDGIFRLYRCATKHTIAFVTRKNGELITQLLSTPYAMLKED